jgi:hypothetical protein
VEGFDFGGVQQDFALGRGSEETFGFDGHFANFVKAAFYFNVALFNGDGEIAERRVGTGEDVGIEELARSAAAMEISAEAIRMWKESFLSKTG